MKRTTDTVIFALLATVGAIIFGLFLMGIVAVVVKLVGGLVR